MPPSRSEIPSPVIANEAMQSPYSIRRNTLSLQGTKCRSDLPITSAVNNGIVTPLPHGESSSQRQFQARHYEQSEAIP